MSGNFTTAECEFAQETEGDDGPTVRKQTEEMRHKGMNTPPAFIIMSPDLTV